MTLIKNITKNNKGKHLSFEERVSIQHWKKEGLSNREIARRLKRAPQTIHNEVKRGMTIQCKQQKYNGKIYRYEFSVYLADLSQHKYETNRKNCGRKYKWINHDSLLDCLDKLMNKKNKFSPDVALHILRKEDLFSKDIIPCTTTLYRWIDLGFLKTKNIDLQLKSQQNTKSKRVRKNKMILGMSIDKRPKHIQNREIFGHWEIDTIVGVKDADEPVLLTLTERKTRFEIILKANSKTSNAINLELEILKNKLGCLFPKLFRSITSDNGLEFAGLTELFMYEVPIFFTHPYSSWERGTNENHNRMIRRFIPKGERMSKFSTTKIKMIQQWMNDLPRKILNYETPHEAFVREISQLNLDIK